MIDCDEHGFFINRTSVTNIGSPWFEVMNEALSVFRAYLGSELHSVYIRGSVPNGTASIGVSDIDLLAVLHRELTGADRTWRLAEEAKFRERNPLPGEVELDLVPLSHIMEPRGLLWRFALATQSLCVHGQDLIPDLPRFSPTRRLGASLAAGTRRHVIGAISRLETAEPSAVARICRRAAKHLLRSAAALVIDREGYSRDLREAASLFAKRYPYQSGPAVEALTHAVTPSCDRERVRQFLNSFGLWIADEVDRTLLTEFED